MHFPHGKNNPDGSFNVPTHTALETDPIEKVDTITNVEAALRSENSRLKEQVSSLKR